MSVNTDQLRLAKLRRKNLTDLATIRELVWLAHNDDATLAEAINALGVAGNVRTVKKTVGAPGVAGTDHNFTSVGNMTEQSIQLGGTTIVPANSPVISMVAKARVGATGGNTIVDIGTSSGSDEYMMGIDLTALNSITSVSAQVVANAAASSVYFSVTPDANWNTITNAVWDIFITYVDNSTI